MGTTGPSFDMSPHTDLHKKIQELDRAPASTQLLSETRVGEAVAQVSKLEEGAAPANIIRYVHRWLNSCSVSDPAYVDLRAGVIKYCFCKHTFDIFM